MLLGGVIGAFITFTVIKGMELLGPARSVMLIVVSQLIVAYVIELFGMFGVEKQPFEWQKSYWHGRLQSAVLFYSKCREKALVKKFGFPYNEKDSIEGFRRRQWNAAMERKIC